MIKPTCPGCSVPMLPKYSPNIWGQELDRFECPKCKYYLTPREAELRAKVRV